MTSHATLTCKRSLHSTSLCCSLHATHTDCSHCITPQACARASHTLLSHLGSLQHHHQHTTRTGTGLSHTRKTPLGSLSRSIHALIPARIARSHLSINHASTLDKMRVGALIARLFSMARQASYPTAGEETDRSLSHHMYYQCGHARHPALTRQGQHRRMIRIALNK